MATLGTFVAGQVLAASELNAIATFTDWTSTMNPINSGGGTFTTTKSGKYSIINKLFVAEFSVEITTATSAGFLYVNLPGGLGLAMQTARAVGIAVEDLVTNDLCYAWAQTTTQIYIKTYDGSNTATAGRRYRGTIAAVLT